MSNYIGIDLGASKIAAGLISRGRVIRQLKVKTPKANFRQQIIKTLKQIIDELKAGQKVYGVGLGLAGRVDNKRGFVYNAPNLPGQCKNFPLAKKLQSVCRLPVRVDNDVHCFTLAEHHYGQARGYKHVVGLTLGTGLGGGIMVDGKLYRGQDNTAGEFGHTFFSFKNKELVKFEALASGTAVKKFYQRLAKKKLSAIAVEQLALRGDQAAIAAYQELAQYLAIGLVNIINSLNPEIIVIGGGIARAKPKLWLVPAVKEARKRVLTLRAAKTKIVVTKLGDQAGILGAGLLFGNR